MAQNYNVKMSLKANKVNREKSNKTRLLMIQRIKIKIVEKFSQLYAINRLRYGFDMVYNLMIAKKHEAIKYFPSLIVLFSLIFQKCHVVTIMFLRETNPKVYIYIRSTICKCKAEIIPVQNIQNKLIYVTSIAAKPFLYLKQI